MPDRLRARRVDPRARPYSVQVPNRFSASTRATDDDRVLVCRTLDEALADGQLSGAEHESRVSSAMHAKTVGELRGLVRDLQSDNPLPQPRAASSPSSSAFRIVVPAVATVLLLVLLIALAGRVADDDDDSGPVGGDGEEVADGLLDLDGLTKLVAEIRDGLGTTKVDDLTIYDEYAVVEVPDPQSARQALSYYYDGDFRDPSEGGTRDAKIEPVDLTTVDLARLAGVIAGVGQSVNLETVEQVYVVMRGTEDGPEILVYGNNGLGDSGHISLAPDGEFNYTYPFDPEG